MDSNNLILYLPFDESEGSLIAYDYSKSRADALISGATFVQGKDGNAIKFSGNDTCEVLKNILPNLSANFSMLMWIQVPEIENGTSKELIWILNFNGQDNYVEIPIEIKSRSWFYVGLIRNGSEFDFYVNAVLVKNVNKTDTLIGISLNQDYDGGEYGLGLLDDVKFYDIALTQSDILNEIKEKNNQTYYLDGVDFREYGVFVSDSEGIVSRPKLKTPMSISWDNYHGESVDLQHKFYEPREITLSCFIKANSKIDFLKKVSEFEQLFDKKGTNRLLIDVHPTKPLIYEIYCSDEIAVSKKWNDSLMVGTFKLKLIEPEPVKRILKHLCNSEATKTCTITLTSVKLVNIYWGDGSVDYDISGDNFKISHNYDNNGDFFPVITGCLDEISKFETNAIVVWNKL